MNEELPKAIHEGELEVIGVKLKVCVLEDGTRVIEQQSFLDFMNALAGGVELSREEAEKVAKFIHS